MWLSPGALTLCDGECPRVPPPWTQSLSSPVTSQKQTFWELWENGTLCSLTSSLLWFWLVFPFLLQAAEILFPHYFSYLRLLGHVCTTALCVRRLTAPESPKYPASLEAAYLVLIIIPSAVLCPGHGKDMLFSFLHYVYFFLIHLLKAWSIIDSEIVLPLVRTWPFYLLL